MDSQGHLSEFFYKEAGAMVGQGGQMGTQRHSRPTASEVSRKFGGLGVLPGQIFGATPFRLA